MSHAKRQNWVTIMPRIEAVYRAWGPAVTAEIFGLSMPLLATAAAVRGITYDGPVINHCSPPLSDRCTAARAWMAEHGIAEFRCARMRPGIVSPPGVEPGVQIKATWPGQATPAYMPPTVKAQVIPPSIDPRRPPTAPPRIFSATPPGIDPLSHQPWAAR